jgi:hypothetical protein
LGHAKLHEESVEGRDRYVRKLRDAGANHGDAFLRREEGRFARVFRDSDGYAVEEPRGAGEHVEVAARDRVEGSRVDAVAHGGERGGGKGAERSLAMRF